MIYKIVMMSGKEIPLRNEEALKDFFTRANSGAKLIVTEFGIVNVASIDCIIEDEVRRKEMNELRRYKRDVQEDEVLPKKNETFLGLIGEKRNNLLGGGK